MSALFGGGVPSGILTKSKVFVSYHHGGDRQYYDSFSSTFCDAYDVVYDNSPERKIDSEDARYVIQHIRDKFITGSSCTIVLVGQHTWGRKYVDWEIDATLEREHGLIGAYLPTAARRRKERSSFQTGCMPTLSQAMPSGLVGNN